MLTREVPRAALADAIPPEIEAATRASGPARPQRLASTFDRLSETIDADIDADLEAELREVVRVVGGLRKASKAMAAAPEARPPDATAEALSELTDESSQKTREVLQIGREGEGGATASAGAERDEATDRALVQARYALVEDGDYYQLLGVSRETGADELRRAGEMLLRRLASQALHPFVAAELAEQLKEIRIVVGEAVRLLGNDELRVQYRAHLPAAPGEAAGEPA